MNRLLTASGQPIEHLQDAAVDERFVAMTANPFLHGCCDCGLFHRVEYKIVDAEGHELQIPEGAMLALRFSRDEDQTEHFRAERQANDGVPIWKDLHDVAQDLILDASIAGVAGSQSPDMMRLQAINRYRTDPLFSMRIRELTTRILAAAMKHQVELGLQRRGVPSAPKAGDIDRKFRISAINPVNGKEYDETNSLLLCAKDAAVPAALNAYHDECIRLGANWEHVESIHQLIYRVRDFQAAAGGGRIPDTVGAEILRCVEGVLS